MDESFFSSTAKKYKQYHQNYPYIDHIFMLHI